MNLICEEPFSIALIGSMGFISFALGGIMFTDTMDRYGRKKILIQLSLVLPILMALMVPLAKSLVPIYIFVFVMGLTYCTRNAAAYIYSAEFVENKYRLKVGQYHFMSIGI